VISSMGELQMEYSTRSSGAGRGQNKPTVTMFSVGEHGLGEPKTTTPHTLFQ
jgi:hypothetical protein